MEHQEKIVCLTENELNFQLIQIAEEHGMSDEVTTTLNREFIQQYTVLKQIPVDLASIIRLRYEAIVSEAREKWHEYINALNKLSK